MNKRQLVRDWLKAHADQYDIDSHELASLLGVEPYDVNRVRSDLRRQRRERGEEALGRLTESREFDARYTHAASLRKEVGHLKSVGLDDWRTFALGDTDFITAINALSDPLERLWALVNDRCAEFEITRAQREQRGAVDTSPAGVLAARIKRSSSGQVVKHDWRFLRVNAGRVIAEHVSGTRVEITGENCCLEAAELVYGERHENL